ncbi:LysR family transcriptional regulator [Bradyrhizobium sp. 169]|uniref:helix-turn-helix domain-containing protein n=1 Tax=unclassified Bradyrhizobium TaxID=2631580 RepID=UPI0031F5F5D8
MLGSQQSSLSRRISEFEHDLGVPFFERFSGGVRPTRPGRDVLRSQNHPGRRAYCNGPIRSQQRNRPSERRFLHITFGRQSASLPT